MKRKDDRYAEHEWCDLCGGYCQRGYGDYRQHRNVEDCIIHLKRLIEGQETERHLKEEDGEQ